MWNYLVPLCSRSPLLKEQTFFFFPLAGNVFLHTKALLVFLFFFFFHFFCQREEQLGLFYWFRLSLANIILLKSKHFAETYWFQQTYDPPPHKACQKPSRGVSCSEVYFLDHHGPWRCCSTIVLTDVSQSWSIPIPAQEWFGEGGR